MAMRIEIVPKLHAPITTNAVARAAGVPLTGAGITRYSRLPRSRSIATRK